MKTTNSYAAAKYAVMVFICLKPFVLKANSTLENANYPFVKICTEVNSREPVKCLDNKLAFIAVDNSSKVILKAVLRQKKSPLETGLLTHEWWYQNKIVFTKNIPAGEAGFRSYSQITLRGRSGDWAFKLKNSSGQILKQIDFEVLNSRKNLLARLKNVIEFISETKVAKEIKTTQVSDTETVVTLNESDLMIGAGIGVEFSRIDSSQKSNRSEARYLSKANPSLQLAARYFWPQKSHSLRFRTDVSVFLTKVGFENDSAVSVNGLPTNSFKLNADQSFYFVDSRWLYNLGLSTSQDYYEMATQMNNLNFSSKTRTLLNAGIDYNFYEHHDLSYFAKARAVTGFSRDDINNEIGYNLGLLIKWQETQKLYFLEIEAEYANLSNSTSFVDRTRSDFTTYLKAYWKY